MKKFSEAPWGGYQTPECEVISLICDGAVIMSGSESKIDDWYEDGDGINIG